MKRLIAILMLGVLLYNWVGYQLYVAIRENRENRNMITRLDNDLFRDSELVSIKIAAVHISPYVNEKGFERVNGQIEVQGRVFNYVKRRFVQDSLEFLCIPNDQATLLRIAKYDFFKLVADLQAEQSKKTGSGNNMDKSLNGEYFPEKTDSLPPVFHLVDMLVAEVVGADPRSGYPDFRDQPPQFSC